MEIPATTKKHNEVPIRNIGSYFELDAEGFVINPTSLDKIQEDWKPALGEVVESYKKVYGDALTTVYIRGSVAKGTAIKYISDIDSFAYATLTDEEISLEWTDAAEKEIIEKYPFIQGVELSVDPVTAINADQILLAQSICIYGQDISINIPKLKPGREMITNLFKLNTTFEWFRNKLELIGGNEEELKRACVWLSKTLLRAGFELTVGRSHRYTRDLYPCFETFAEYYPEREGEMKKVLYLALNPITDKNVFLTLMDGLGRWIMKEAKVQYA
jgi:hypothetical protein